MKKIALCALMLVFMGFSLLSLKASEWGHIYQYTYYSNCYKNVVVGHETYNTCTNQRTFSGTITMHYNVSTTSLECGSGGPAL